MTRFLVTGASGLLGINFSLHALARGHQVWGTVNHNGLKNSPFEVLRTDLCTPGAFARIIDLARPDVIIHTAALAVIDACEAQPDLSRRVNAELPGEIAELTRKKGLQLVHISTDAVFDGIEGNYSEDSLPNPLSTYARHKLEGEKAVLGSNPDAAVARVNFFGWSINGTRSLSEIFYRNLSEGKPIKGFNDIYFCPLMVTDLAILLMDMAAQGLKGLYHVLSPVYLSKYAFGVLIARQFGFDPGLIISTSWKEGGLQAVRSPNLILKVDKLMNDLGVTPPEPQDGIGRFYQSWQDGYADRVRSMLDTGATAS